MRRLLNVDYYNAIFFNVTDLATMTDVEKSITQLLRIRHRISPLRPDDFQVQSQRELIDAQISAADRLAFLVRWIGFCALLVSGLGIMAIAWIAVRDRTTEIGTRRALGATAGEIFFQFSLEATLLAIIGVTLGLFIAWWASQIIADAAGLVFVYDSANASLAVIVAVVFNLLFASWPALRAARLDPINALNHE
jgi:putative ABC transport system permease protein